MDLKLLVALRTEFYGEFVDGVTRILPTRTGVVEEMLRELDEEQIEAVIEFPTKIENGHYNFEYGTGVANHISSDLMAAPTRGGKLPVMQIVCGRLYRDAMARARASEPAIIERTDYDRLGGVRQQVMEHVNGVLGELCRREGIWWGVEAEVRRWYRVMEELVTVQVDGTVTTNQRTSDEVRSKVKEHGCRVAFDRAVQFLCDEDQRVLREDEVYHVESGGGRTCYSLGHDSIGLAVTLRGEQRRVAEGLRTRQKWTRIALATYGMGVGGTLSVLGNSGTELTVATIAVGLGAVLVWEWWRGR